MLTPDSNPKPRSTGSSLRPSPSGARVVIGLIIFGMLILGGLFIATYRFDCSNMRFVSRMQPPQAPANALRGAPDRKLRFVSYDLHGQHPIRDPLFASILPLDPDYVLLQGVDEDDREEIASLLHMQLFFPQLYQRSEHLAGRKGTWGNLILSRHSLYQGAPLGGERGGYGASAVSVVDGREFFIACTHLAPESDAETADFENRWKAFGSPPMVAVVLPSPSSEHGSLDSADAKPPAGLGFFPVVQHVGWEWFYLTKEWTILGQGTAPVGGSGLVPVWIDVSKTSVNTTRP